ncbi:bile acid:sodium symporter [Micrococcus luteus]|uniref:bile acid:sodium symporter n=1 Tax=Micrococcus luteus TaxID=1270 RepID=UPI0019D10BBB|nr:bile acid:sodium symporter [Micrococcus luteus]MBN6751692.1 bile acid:sodium symporter [Micrococcus luteus]MBN6761740.1 bile acid:sodium symporter [Micrococcus luteus]MBN6802119.1 bile acid:sodium symporter [Micrococcus luteus]
MPSSSPRRALVAALERHQVALYLAGIAAGAVVGWAVPGADAWAVLVEPVLALLLLATFLAVPFAALGAGLRDGRFLAALLVLNFVVVPAVVFGLSRFVAHDDALLVGVLLVLLAPCVDYVIAFTALAGGAAERLLAAAPLLMLVQLVVLPVLLRVVAGEAAVAAVDVGPFVRALVMLILVPLALAALLQWGAVRGRGGVRDTAAGVVRGFTAARVPLMVVTLFTVVASQIRGVGERLPALAAVVPLFVAFAAVMVALGVVAARWARLDVPAGRALVFSGVTRNSLVVLPLALALPASLDPAPLVVVTQTLVELGAMVSLVRLVPRLLPLHGESAGAGEGRTVT